MSRTVREARIRRHRRVRKKIFGTPERPRLAVYRSNRHVYVQLIDDLSGRTVAAASTRDPGFAGGGTPVEQAARVGRLVAQRALESGVNAAVFDRGGFLYHGRVKALGDGAREQGLGL
ncbi:MAG: 50S ribosomal protein L18 [Actinomycetota bacterium]